MVLRALGLHRKFLWQESNPNMQFGCIARNLMHFSGLKLFHVPQLPIREQLFQQQVALLV
jgi:hypothetical protein